MGRKSLVVVLPRLPRCFFRRIPNPLPDWEGSDEVQVSTSPTVVEDRFYDPGADDFDWHLRADSDGGLLDLGCDSQRHPGWPKGGGGGATGARGDADAGRCIQLHRILPGEHEVLLLLR